LKICILNKFDNSYHELLQEFFEEIDASVVWSEDPLAIRQSFSKESPKLLFIHPDFFSAQLIQALNVYKTTTPNIVIFQLGGEACVFEQAMILKAKEFFAFQKEILATLQYKDKIRVLVVDDEIEIGRMIQEFFEMRNAPSFEVRCAQNGEEGLAVLEKFKPHVLISDIKMPVMDGREMYQKIHEKKLSLPTVIFLDVVSGSEGSELREYGRPVLVEKGTPKSAVPELFQLVKKLYYFNSN
jgi:CheY-like chemotaxis protein